MMYIYLIHSSTASLLSRAVGIYTKNKYNHVSISFNQELGETYSFGRKQRHNPLWGGFVHEDLKEGLFTEANCQIYRMSVSQAEYAQVKAALHDFEVRSQELKYNFLGLLLLPWEIDFKRPNHYFCSEFILTLLEAKKTLKMPKTTNFMTPQDLKNLPEMVFVYEGLISSYLELNELAKLGYPLAWDTPVVAY